MVVASVDILLFSLEIDQVLVEGDIISNKVFVGLVYCSVIDRRTDP